MPKRTEHEQTNPPDEPGDESSWWTNWHLFCPECRTSGLVFSDDSARCLNCAHIVERKNNIWHFISGEQLNQFRMFLETYTRVRIAEGRGSYDHAIIQSLPLCPRQHRLAGQWRIRARSFASLAKLLSSNLRRDDRILDLGAGIGWLSNRLSLAGYRPLAIDLSVDADDGLGMARSFATEWPCLRAKFDSIPLASGQVEAVIFNASFHYCVDQEQTIAEAIRVLAPGGLLIILDTPIYRDESSGHQMLNEQQQYFEKLIGTRSDSLPTTGFLSWRRLDELAVIAGLSWNYRRPWYGMRWAVRPFLAKLFGKREPATFAIIWAKKH